MPPQLQPLRLPLPPEREACLAFAAAALDTVKPLAVKSISCGTGQAADDLEQTVTGSTALKYDTTGNFYPYNWKTPSQANTCWLVTVSTTDGAQQHGQFKFR